MIISNTSIQPLEVQEEPVSGLLPAIPGISASRRRLYEAAIELFGQRGYHGVSVKDLTDKLGIKPPSLYAHVASKQELLFELAMIGLRAHRDALNEALRTSMPYPLAQVRALMHAHVLVHLKYPYLARTINTEERHLDPEHGAKIREIRDDATKMLKKVIDRGLESGEFQVPNLGRMLRLIADLGVHTAEWPERPDVSEHEKIADDYAEIALRLLGPRR